MTKREVVRSARALPWAALAAEAMSEAEEVADECGEWSLEGRAFVGTVFALLPSGKFYTPWANNNVAACGRCKGSGKVSSVAECSWCGGIGSREAFLDEVWWEAAEAAAEAAGVWLESGEGDPCDVFVVYREAA